MRRKITAFGGGAALVIAAITIPATTAAAVNYDITINVPHDRVQAESTLTWSIEDTATPICDDATVILDGGSQPAQIITVNDDGLGGEIDLAAASSHGAYEFAFTIVCDDDDYSGHAEFIEVEIYKTVLGDDYYSTGPFQVTVNASSEGNREFSDTISFDTQGGSVFYYGFAPSEWTVEEIDNGGAYRVETDAPQIFNNPGQHTIGVTNYFPETTMAFVTPATDGITTETVWQWETNPEHPPVCEDGEVITESWDPLTDTTTIPSSPFEISVDDQGYSGTIDIAGASVSGEYYTDILCEVDGVQIAYWIDVQLDIFELTKQVEGDAPTGSTFDIEVTGSEFAFDDEGNPVQSEERHTKVVSFPENGGTQKLYHSIDWELGPLFWSVEEIADGGADEVAIDIVSAYFDDGPPAATVINTFEAEEPTDDPVDEPKDDPADDPKDEPKKDDPKGSPSDEPAAKPVKVTPTYAG